MFWHGRSFGLKYSNFMKWFNYKSYLNSIPIMYLNAAGFYSGFTVYDDLFTALYQVVLTIWVNSMYMLDQDVDMRLTN